jgi:hypothetical protein
VKGAHNIVTQGIREVREDTIVLEGFSPAIKHTDSPTY